MTPTPDHGPHDRSRPPRDLWGISEWGGERPPAMTVDEAEKLLAHPVARRVYQAFNVLASMDEGVFQIASGVASGMLGRPPTSELLLAHKYPLMPSWAEQEAVGYAIGIELRRVYTSDAEDAGADYWPYGETPEQWIARWRSALDDAAIEAANPEGGGGQ